MDLDKYERSKQDFIGFVLSKKKYCYFDALFCKGPRTSTTHESQPIYIDDPICTYIYSRELSLDVLKLIQVNSKKKYETHGRDVV